MNIVEHTDRKFITWMHRRGRSLETEFMEENSERFVCWCADKYDNKEE